MESKRGHLEQDTLYPGVNLMLAAEDRLLEAKPPSTVVSLCAYLNYLLYISAMLLLPLYPLCGCMPNSLCIRISAVSNDVPVRIIYDANYGAGETIQHIPAKHSREVNVE